MSDMCRLWTEQSARRMETNRSNFIMCNFSLSLCFLGVILVVFGNFLDFECEFAYLLFARLFMNCQSNGPAFGSYRTRWRHTHAGHFELANNNNNCYCGRVLEARLQ